MKRAEFIKLLLAMALVFFVSGTVYAEWQIEYDETAARVLYLGENRRRGNFATCAECEKYRTSRPQFEVMHSSCVGYDSPAAAPSRAPAARPRRTTPSYNNDREYRRALKEQQRRENEELRRAKEQQKEEQRKEAERRLEFEKNKMELLGTMKGVSSHGLKLKSSASSESLLKLKGAGTVRAGSAAPRAYTEKQIQEARKRILKLQWKVMGIQTLLRQFSRTLMTNSSEFETWQNTVDESYRNVLDNSKDYVLGLFIEKNLFGSLKGVRKDAFGKLERITRSSDPKIRRWLAKELGGRRIDPKQFEKVVKLGLAEGDFAGLLATDDNAEKYLNALILTSDLLEIVEKDVPGGNLFQHARMIGSTYADLASICYSWFSINRLTRENEKYAREVSSLSFRMREAMKEMKCLEHCLDNYSDRCMEKCAGKTRLSTPPPLPK